jgi:hypothetical protein
MSTVRIAASLPSVAMRESPPMPARIPINTAAFGFLIADKLITK